MKNKTLLLLVFLFTMSAVNAQTLGVKHIEGELRFGITNPIGGFHGAEQELTPALGMEIRYNLNKKNLPIDFGIAFDMMYARYVFHKTTDEDQLGFDYDQENNTTIFSVFSDYNFRQGKDVSPFVGLGLGISIMMFRNGRCIPEATEPLA